MATKSTPPLSDAVHMYLSKRRRLAHNSFVRERDVLLRFVRHVGDKQVGRLTDADYEGFYDACADGTAPGSRKPLGEAALRQVRLRLKWFSDFAVSKGWHRPGLCDLEKPAKEMPRDFVRLSVEEIERGLDLAERPRDRMLLAMAAFSGLRSQTVIALRVHDFNLDHDNRTGTIRVQIFKSRKVRTIAISPDLYDEIIRWVTAYHAECGPIQGEWYFVPGNDRNKFDYSTGERRSVPGRLVPTKQISKPEDVAHRVLAAMGLDNENEGMHTFRRSYAMNLYDRLVQMGVADPMKVVSEALHHTSVQVTERYIGIDYGQQRKDGIIRTLSFRQESNVVPLLKDGTDG